MNLTEVVQAKQELLQARMKRMNLDALRAMASMQQRPHPFLTTVEMPTALVGQIRYQMPTTGDLSTRYDPVLLAKSYLQAGADAIAVFTDSVLEYDGTSDLTLISAALRSTPAPLIAQDYVLHEYHIVEMRAAGASVVMLNSSILPTDKLRQLTSAAHRNLMTAVVEVFDLEQLETALTWSPQVIGLSSPNPLSFNVDLLHVATLRKHIPPDQRVMITRPLHTFDEVQHAGQIGVDAVIVTDRLMLSDMTESLKAVLKR